MLDPGITTIKNSAIGTDMINLIKPELQNISIIHLLKLVKKEQGRSALIKSHIDQVVTTTRICRQNYSFISPFLFVLPVPKNGPFCVFRLLKRYKAVLVFLRS